jgi:pimeloyl-ACP methyl ester carboxylesterase
MERARVNGVELEYTVAGRGEPVVFLHGGLLADENVPIAKEPALTGHYRTINYHRRGFAGSEKPAGRAQIQDQVADCKALLEHLGIEKAHLIGHSLGGVIAMQMAIDHPDMVQSLVLLEPAIMGAIAKAEAAGRPDAAENQRQFIEGMRRVAAIYDSGDVRGALTTFLETRAGGAFREVLDWLTRTGEFDQAVKDAGTFLKVEMPAAYAWDFTPADAKRITQPTLSVLGSHSPARAQKVHEILTQWIPQTETLTLVSAEHALPLLDPPGIAVSLAEYLAKHPM